jgi:uncharacterized membrane protein
MLSAVVQRLRTKPELGNTGARREISPGRQIFEDQQNKKYLIIIFLV